MKFMRNKFIIICGILLFFSVFIIICIRPQSVHKIKYDTYYVKQWYLQNKVSNFSIEPTTDEMGFSADRVNINSKIDLGIDDFWNDRYNTELTIAVIDSKIDINHEDLSNHIWYNTNEIPNNGIDDDNNGYIDDTNGWNFYSNTKDIYSKEQNAIHGTHCAGIIAANHNEIGIMGILGNTNVKIMVLPVFETINEEVDFKNLISAIKYAQKMGADICNISSVCKDGHKELYEVMEKSDMIFVVAAGNFQNAVMSGLNLEKYPRYPACIDLPNVVTVGSVNGNAEHSEFSNYSSKFVNICAPGEFIYSTLPDGKYGYESGTSMATPIVASVLGAYYYTAGENMDEALELLYNYSETNSDIDRYVYNGRIVHFIKLKREEGEK